MEDFILSEEEIKDVKNKVKDFSGDSESLDILSSIFKALSDPTRLKIIFALSHNSLCVSDISSALDMSQSSISHQLSLLKKMNLVKSEKQGRNVIYSLDDEHVLSLFNEGYEHAKHRKKCD